MAPFTPEGLNQYNTISDAMIVRLAEAVKADTQRALQEGVMPSIISLSVGYAAICLAAKYAVLTLVSAQLETTDAQAPSDEEHIAMAVRLRDRLLETLKQGLDAEAAALDPQRPEPFSWPGKPGTA